MRGLMHGLGMFMATVPTVWLTVAAQGGWRAVLLFGALLAPLGVILTGGLVGSSFPFGADWSLRAASVAQVTLLGLMVVTLWLSRLQNLTVSRVAAALYLAAGLGFIATEANTGASAALGLWPDSQSSFMDILRFGRGLLLSFTGWVMLLWQLSLFPVLGNALMDPDRRQERALIDESLVNGQGGATPSLGADRVLKPRRKLDDMAGMSDLKRQLREFAANFQHYGRRNRRLSEVNGLLLGGPPGNGKTAFAEALAGELGFGFLKVGVKDLASHWVNETPGKIAEAFATAVAHAPCVLFLDEIDAVGRDRGGHAQNQHGEDIKAVNALLQEIDNLRQYQVVLVAASNFVDRLDAALVRPGRFDVRIEIPLPDAPAREGLLSALLEQAGLKAETEVVHRVALLWEQRSAAFIEATVKRLRQELRRAGRQTVGVEDLKAAGRAASRREGAIPKTGVPLSRLQLPASTRREAESIVYRLQHWESLAERGGTPPTGVLLYGPPGTGKTNLVRAMALELGDWHVFEVRVAEMLADPRTFDAVLAQAREHRPAFVFMDEADDLLRDRACSPNATATNEILKAMDGMMGSVPELVFIAATNNPDVIDAAAKRGGRFGEKIFMDLFDGEDLVALARSELARRPAARFAEDVTPQWIAETFGPIGPADLVALIGKAINASLTGAESVAIRREDLAGAREALMG